MGLKRQKYSSLGDLLDHEPITEEDVNVRPAESNSGARFSDSAGCLKLEPVDFSQMSHYLKSGLTNTLSWRGRRLIQASNKEVLSIAFDITGQSVPSTNESFLSMSLAKPAGRERRERLHFIEGNPGRPGCGTTIALPDSRLPASPSYPPRSWNRPSQLQPSTRRPQY